MPFYVSTVRMPELPEVETAVRLLRPDIVGRTITGVRVRWERTLGGLDRRRFSRAIRGARMASIWRRAKYILIDLERDGLLCGHLIGHLRMTGRLFVEPHGSVPAHVRVSLALDDGRSLHFLDVRKFGRLTFADDPSEVLPELGPEPLDKDFSAAWLRDGLARRRRLIKPMLLDQSFLAGLGNIYVDESLHLAGIHPLATSDRVSAVQSNRLHRAIQDTLEAAIEREGSSFDDFYRTPEGKPGSFQHQFQVYGRQGRPCRSCGAEVIRIVVGQRGTHLCPRCQRRPRARPRR